MDQYPIIWRFRWVNNPPPSPSFALSSLSSPFQLRTPNASSPSLLPFASQAPFNIISHYVSRVGGLANGFHEYDEQASHSNEGDDTLPLSHLTPTTLLGAGDSERETRGQLLGAAIGSLILERKPEERRTLVLGLGLRGRGFGGEDEGREGFRSLIELVGRIV